MSEWIEDLTGAYDIEALSGPEVNKLLGAARDVAHSTERKAAPLGSFVLGLEVARRMQAGASRDEALDGALEILRSTIPDEPLHEDGS